MTGDDRLVGIFLILIVVVFLSPLFSIRLGAWYDFKHHFSQAPVASLRSIVEKRNFSFTQQNATSLQQIVDFCPCDRMFLAMIQGYPRDLS